jgi:hypothetical protein
MDRCNSTPRPEIWGNIGALTTLLIDRPVQLGLLLTQRKQSTETFSNRQSSRGICNGTFASFADDPKRVVILSDRRELKDPSSPLFESSHLGIGFRANSMKSMRKKNSNRPTFTICAIAVHSPQNAGSEGTPAHLGEAIESSFHKNSCITNHDSEVAIYESRLTNFEPRITALPAQSRRTSATLSVL